MGFAYVGFICIRYYVVNFLHSSVFLLLAVRCILKLLCIHVSIGVVYARYFVVIYFLLEFIFFTFLCAPVSLGDAPQDFREIVSCSCGRDCSVLVLALPFGSAAGTLVLLNVKREQLA